MTDKRVLYCPLCGNADVIISNREIKQHYYMVSESGCCTECKTRIYVEHWPTRPHESLTKKKPMAKALHVSDADKKLLYELDNAIMRNIELFKLQYGPLFEKDQERMSGVIIMACLANGFEATEAFPRVKVRPLIDSLVEYHFKKLEDANG